MVLYHSTIGTTEEYESVFKFIKTPGTMSYISYKHWLNSTALQNKTKDVTDPAQ